MTQTWHSGRRSGPGTKLHSARGGPDDNWLSGFLEFPLGFASLERKKSCLKLRSLPSGLEYRCIKHRCECGSRDSEPIPFEKESKVQSPRSKVGKPASFGPWTLDLVKKLDPFSHLSYSPAPTQSSAAGRLRTNHRFRSKVR